MTETRDSFELHKRFERDFATNPTYIEMYRRGTAYHGAHPFYMWYWACYGQSYLGKVIVVGAQDLEVAETLGYATASTMEEALGMAEDIVGRSPKVTAFHYPPIFLCDIS